MSKKRGKKKYELNEEQKTDIRDTFKLFDKEECGEIDAEDLQKAMLALGFKSTKKEINNILKEIEDEDNEGKVSYDEFFELMSSRISEKSKEEMVSKVFAMFDTDKSGKIRLKDLKRVAKELGEKLSEEDLKEMIEYTAEDSKGYVTLKDFKTILEKTGIN